MRLKTIVFKKCFHKNKEESNAMRTKKQPYQTIELNVIELEAKDVITNTLEPDPNTNNDLEPDFGNS